MNDPAQIAEEALYLGDKLTRYAQSRVCELFEATECTVLSRSYVENRILDEFQAAHGWHRDLGSRKPAKKDNNFGAEQASFGSQEPR